MLVKKYSEIDPVSPGKASIQLELAVESHMKLLRDLRQGWPNAVPCSLLAAYFSRASMCMRKEDIMQVH